MLLKCKLLGMLTSHQAETLLRLKSASNHAALLRPKDLGAFRGSHHSKTLVTLVNLGYAMRVELSEGRARPTYGYRITSLGVETAALFKQLAFVPPESVPGGGADRRSLGRARALCQ